MKKMTEMDYSVVTTLHSTVQMVATNFATWMEDNYWKAVFSKKLGKRAWVDKSKHDVYVNGSDFHFTKLIKEHGKTIDELYDMFVLDEQKRLKEKAELVK